MKIIKHFIFKSNVSFYDKILSTVKETYADLEELTTQNHQNFHADMGADILDAE